jgi:predicted dehydrogenase
MGAIGLGHWFFRLHDELKRSRKVELYKAAATSDFEAKKGILDQIDIPKERYYRIKPGDPIPKEFMEGLDIVYISTPNEFHAADTMQALAEGKYVVTEKTYGSTEKEFGEVVKFIKENGYEKMCYLHLHYLHKPLVVELPKILEKISATHGKVEKFAAVFWEEANEVDEKRAKWLLTPANGGIFMDWVHPFEVLFNGAEADDVKITDVQLNELNSDYSTEYPTGVDAQVKITGEYFADDCKGVIRVGKGLPKGYGRKVVQMRFASGALLNMSFVSYENELDTFQTGYWELSPKEVDVNSVALDFGRPTASSDLFAKAIADLAEGNGPELSLSNAVRIFEPQWEYQRLAKGKKLVKLEMKELDLPWTLV